MKEGRGPRARRDDFRKQGWKKAVKVAKHGAKRNDRDESKNREERRSEGKGKGKEGKEQKRKKGH